MQIDYNPDQIAKHLWIALIVVVILAAIVIIFIPGVETRSECRGFQYLYFLDHKLTENQYEIELLNGIRDIEIKSATLEGVNLGVGTVSVPAGEVIKLTSQNDPTNKRVEETFRYKLVITYDIDGGINDNKDTATCTGKVQ